MNAPGLPGWAVFSLAMLGACAPLSPPPGARPSSARTAPEEGEVPAMVPAAAEALLVIDLAQLRASPWSQAIVAARAGGADRSERTLRRGFDEMEDVDLWALATLPGPVEAPPSLEIVQGRFARARLEEAFRARRPAAVWSDVRGTRVLADATEAWAALSERTHLFGDPAVVRAAIDAAWGRARSVSGEAWRNDLEAALDEEGGRRPRRAALEIGLALGPSARHQVREILPAVDRLKRLGARLTLGGDLRVTAVGLAASPSDARVLAEELGAQVGRLQGRRSIAALGLAGIVDAIEVAASGARLVGRLAVSERDRELVADRMALLAGVLGRAAAPPAGP